MDWLQVVVLAVVQGLTEFLPISSSAHLILVPVLTTWEDQGLAFDVALHLGSLSAVVLYFRQEIWQMIASSLTAVRGNGVNEDARLAFWVVVATLPVCIVGFLLHDLIAGYMRSTLIIGLSLIGFGLLLGYADWKMRGTRSEYQWTLKDALIIGGAQVLALIPGTSRSGITMSSSRQSCCWSRTATMRRKASSRFLNTGTFASISACISTRTCICSECGRLFSVSSHAKLLFCSHWNAVVRRMRAASRGPMR